MYLPKHFEEARSEVLIPFLNAHPLATVVIVNQGSLEANHIPLLVDSIDSTSDSEHAVRLVGHVARANPLWRISGNGIACLGIFHGPDHYVSPNWYATKQESHRVVPTWNYEVVHAHGQLRAIDDPVWLRSVVSRLTDSQESAFPSPWRMSDAPEEYLQRMLQAIVGIEIVVEKLIGKRKMSQNQPVENQRSVVDALRKLDSPHAASVADQIEFNLNSN